MTRTPVFAVYGCNGTVRIIVGRTGLDPAEVVQTNNISIPATAVNAQPWRRGLDEVVANAGYRMVTDTALRNGICGNRGDVRMEGSPLIHLRTGGESSKMGISEIYIRMDAEAYAANIEHVDNLATLIRFYIAANS